jgi:hypothetical protein
MKPSIVLALLMVTMGCGKVAQGQSGTQKETPQITFNTGPVITYGVQLPSKPEPNDGSDLLCHKSVDFYVCKWVKPSVPVVAERAKELRAVPPDSVEIVRVTDAKHPQARACIQPNHIDPFGNVTEVVVCNPEPDEDVPAIQKKRGVQCRNCTDWMGTLGRTTYWTCAEPERILLTAEDGKRFCHKVQP